MQCPLPIDWLEYVEGAKPAELIEHLEACVPCRLLVEDLRRQPRVLLDRKHLASKEWPHWRTTKPAVPQFGEIWWTARVRSEEELPLERLLIVVISDVWKERGHSWCDVVPLTSDIENATSLDMLLSRDDNDLYVPWRALLRHQIVAETMDLDSRIGSLTDDCKAVVRQALNAQAPCERFGSQIESSLDLRLRGMKAVGNLARALAKKYAQALDRDSQHCRVQPG
jgi:mRNA-degrading endonuclease toxin of MazEF toxin-antitoxin module